MTICQACFSLSPSLLRLIFSLNVEQLRTNFPELIKPIQKCLFIFILTYIKFNVKAEIFSVIKCQAAFTLPPAARN